jgi:type IV secretory pathway VirB4 component
VKKAQRAVVAVLEEAGFRASIRSIGALDTYLSTLPGQAKHGVRRHPLDALTVSKIWPIHEADLGRRWSESEAHRTNVPALTYALGPGATFYRAHLNVKDVGHGFTLGRTGAGKSVQASYLAAMFRGRLPLAGVTTIDRGRSSYQLCKMLDGTFYELLGPNSPGFALFSEIEDAEMQRDVLQIISEMVELSGVAVTPSRLESLQSAVRLMAGMPANFRSLFAFYELVQDPDAVLRPALKKYTRLGDLGALLDCSEDSFQTGRFNAVDVARIVGMAPAYLIPIYRTLFWKTLSQVRRLKQSLGADLHWLVNIDEAHTLMGNEIGGRFILDMLKTGRKDNVAVWLSSNSLRDFAGFQYRSDLMLQCASRIYFGDSGATEDDPETVALYRDLQLPPRGIAALPNLPDRGFLLHQPDANVLKQLTLQLDKDVLALVGTSRTIGLVDEYMARYGDEWKVPFLRAQGATDAADRLAAILTRSHKEDLVLA